MLVGYFAHLNRQLKLLQVHVLDVDQVLEKVFFRLLTLSEASLDRNIELLKLVFSAD